MAQVLSLPFRISPAGQAVTVEQGNDAYYEQQIATILLTLEGERLLNEDIGSSDEAFIGFLNSSFQAQVETLLPEVSDVEVNLDRLSDTSETLTVTFNVTQEQ